MLKRLPIPIKKEVLLALGIILLLWIGYQLAFKKTWQAWQLNREFNRQLSTAAGVSYQPAYLERKSRNLNQLLHSYTTDSVNFRSHSMELLSPIAEKEHCRITAVPADPNHLYTSATYQVQKVSFEGSFADLTRLLQQLEANSQIGIVRSAVWHVVDLHNISHSQRQLILDVYLLTLKQ